MGNCFKQMGTDQTSEASIVKDLTELIAYLTQQLEIKARELEMYRHQSNVFLQEIENKEKEIAIFKYELQTKTLTLRRAYFTN